MTSAWLINQTLEACSWVSRCQQWYMFKRFTWTNTFATCRRRGRQQGAFSTNRLRTLRHKPVTKQLSIRSMPAAAAASGSVARRWHTSRWRWNCTSLLIQLVAQSWTKFKSRPVSSIIWGGVMRGKDWLVSETAQLLGVNNRFRKFITNSKICSVLQCSKVKLKQDNLKFFRSF